MGFMGAGVRLGRTYQGIVMNNADQLPGADGQLPMEAGAGQSVSDYTPIVARRAITIRAGVMADLPFIDGMQKKHSRELGFLPTKALEGKIKLGQVLIAEATGNDEGGTMKDEIGDADTSARSSSLLPVGYLIAADRYQKRDEIGYVTQISVLPAYRRYLVAGQLLQAQFDRSAYGCRLYSCWCAQDLAANAFWEAMGFTAIAFRTGSMKKARVKDEGARMKKDGADASSPDSSCGVQPSALRRARVHIFWQKRIRAGDTATPWWYPSTTGGGELREDRLVFPIPAGVSWRDVGPIVLEQDGAGDAEAEATARRRRARAKPVELPKPQLVSPRERGGMWFEHEGVPDPVQVAAIKKLEEEQKALAMQPKPKAEKPKIDPKLLAMSRQLRDQWTERAGEIVPPAAGKHDVKRLGATPAQAAGLLDQAA